MNKSNEIKYNKLGMPFGTANARLKKAILFDLAQKLNLTNCYRCSSIIETLEDFTIEHKRAWLYSEDPSTTFFDLANIAFSHMYCNSAAGKKVGFPVGFKPPNKKEVVEGFKWCTTGRHYNEVTNFSRDKYKSDGLQTECKECRSKTRSGGRMAIAAVLKTDDGENR